MVRGKVDGLKCSIYLENVSSWIDEMVDETLEAIQRLGNYRRLEESWEDVSYPV